MALRGLAAELFDRFLLPFEIVGLLLLVAVIAAYILAKRPEPADPAARGAGADESPEGPR